MLPFPVLLNLRRLTDDNVDQFVGHDNDFVDLFSVHPLLHIVQCQCLLLQCLGGRTGHNGQLVTHSTVDLHDDCDLVFPGPFDVADRPVLNVDALLVAQSIPQLFTNVGEDGRHQQDQRTN